LIVDKTLLEKNGGAIIRIKDHTVEIKQTRSEQGSRPWVQGNNENTE
jgi:hypothetical protein